MVSDREHLPGTVSGPELEEALTIWITTALIFLHRIDPEHFAPDSDRGKTAHT